MEHNFRLTQLIKEAYRKSRHFVTPLADLKMALSAAFPDPQNAVLINLLRQFDVPVLRRRVILGDIFQGGGVRGGCYEAGNTLNKQKHVFFYVCNITIKLFILQPTNIQCHNSISLYNIYCYMFRHLYVIPSVSFTFVSC
jgi:hypothetical protein